MSQKTKSSVLLWNLVTSGTLTGIDFSPYDHVVALGFNNGDIRFIDSSGKVLWVNEIDAAIQCLKIIEAKKRVVVLDELRRLWCFDFSGDHLFTNEFKVQLTSLEVKSNAIFLWGWQTQIIHLSAYGKLKNNIAIPPPLALLKVIPRKGEFFVIHDKLNLGFYDPDGKKLWATQNPSPIELSSKGLSHVDVSDSGNKIAISGHEKGFWVYDAQNRALNNIQIDGVVTQVAVSRSGDHYLIADAFKQLYLISTQGEILWHKSTNSEILFCRLNQKATRAIVYEKSGTLSCFEFHGERQKRSHFLETDDFSEISEKREIWKKPYPKSDRSFTGILKFSGDGNYFLCGEKKSFSIYDSLGNQPWSKSFMSNFDEAWLSHKGENLVLRNAEEIFIVNIESGRENHLVFYDTGLEDVAFDPMTSALLVLDKEGQISLYTGDGQLVWKRFVKNDLQKVQVDYGRKLAVFKGSGSQLYFLNLKDFRTDKVIIGEPFSKFCLTGTLAYVAGGSGKCYALERGGEIKWKNQIQGEILEIIPLKDKIAFRSKGSTFYFFDEGGELKHKAKYNSRYSQLNCFGKDILEVVTRKNTVDCFDLLTGDLAWKLYLNSGIRATAVSQLANRMVALDQDNFHYYYLTGKPEVLDERASYLEF